MIINEFNAEIQAEVTEINNANMAALKTSNGLSEHSKFIFLSLPKYNNEYSYIVFQNVTDKEKEQLFHMLDKELHEQTYIDIEKQLDKVHFENERLKEELLTMEKFI
ncbi:hypothetical protein FDF74_02740 [Clostridium niameyense]|uniref:Uncharacterized protein n=1 Tax=Clostridium niameyense TaxID=1622073 RepID=A0A6M0R8P1_9CLOT|nr:hypothetical protein [Clostridium niameyense]NEZ46127.1 hypothetical protein [Clostridium niameyense]